MALPISHEDREYQNFVDINGTPHRRVTGSGLTGTFTPSGLSIAGRVTEVLIDNLSWTPLPAVPLAARNAISIQNQTGQEVKLNYSAAVIGYVGMVLPTSGERGYDVTDAIIIYAKSSVGVCTLLVEELS